MKTSALTKKTTSMGFDKFYTELFFMTVLLMLSIQNIKADESSFNKEFAKNPKAIEAIKKGDQTQKARVAEKIKTLDPKTQKLLKGEGGAGKKLRDKGNHAKEPRNATKTKAHIKNTGVENKTSTKALKEKAAAKKAAAKKAAAKKAAAKAAAKKVAAKKAATKVAAKAAAKGGAKFIPGVGTVLTGVAVTGAVVKFAKKDKKEKKKAVDNAKKLPCKALKLFNKSKKC